MVIAMITLRVFLAMEPSSDAGWHPANLEAGKTVERGHGAIRCSGSVFSVPSPSTAEVTELLLASGTGGRNGSLNA